MPDTFTPDELDAAADAVMRRYPDLTGEAFARKVRRVAALIRHSQSATRWTGA